MINIILVAKREGRRGGLGHPPSSLLLCQPQCVSDPQDAKRGKKKSHQAHCQSRQVKQVLPQAIRHI